MKPRTGPAGSGPVPGRLGVPALLLQTLLVVAVALPAGIAIAPAFLGPDRPSDASQTAPPWQQIARHTEPARRQPDGIGPLSAAAAVPAGAALAAQLNETLRPDGAGTFTGIVQDAATGQVLFDRAADEARVPASNMKLLTAGAALRVLGPDRRFSTRVRGRADPRLGGPDRRRRRAPGRRRIRPRAPFWAAPGSPRWRRPPSDALKDDGVTGTVKRPAGRLPLQRPARSARRGARRTLPPARWPRCTRWR